MGNDGWLLWDGARLLATDLDLHSAERLSPPPGDLSLLAQRLELKNGRIMWPVRTALSGKAVTPGGAVELCHILGREEALRRIRQGIAQLS